MRKLIKILSIILITALCFSGCSGEVDNDESINSQISSVSSEVSETEVHKSEKNPQNTISTNESKSESSVQSTEISAEPSEVTSSEISESESSFQESSQMESEDESSGEESEEISDDESSEPEKILDKSIIYEFDTKYFINKLDEDLLDVFIILYDAVQNFEITARFDKEVPSDDLDTLMFLLNYDCPELIQLNGDYSPIYTDESEQNVSGVHFTYNMKEEIYEEYSDELHLFFENLKADINEKTEIEKEKYVYDMIFENCIYDDSEAYSGTVYGTLINHIARCEGICKSFMWCMRELGIECMCVSGVPKWETDAVYAGHSWNIVKINDEYYQLDLTIDNLKYFVSDEKYQNYGFFNVNDKFNDETHQIYDFYKKLGVPECNSEKANYHKMNGLFIYADDDVEEQFKYILENNFFDGKINNVSIKFETLSAQNIAHAHLELWLKDFFKEQEISSFDYNADRDEICQTITVYAEANAENPDE